jgi:hypothetical protein
MRPSPLIVASLVAAAGMTAAAPAFAQSGLRLANAAADLGLAQATRTDSALEPHFAVALTPVGGQGFTFVPPAWFGPGLRVPALDTAGPGRFSLAPANGSALDLRLDRWTLSSSVRTGLLPAQPEASRFDFGASYGMPLAKRHEVVVSGGLGFGASAGLAPTAGQQRQATELLLPYADGTGLRDVGLRLSWRYSLDRNLYVNTSVGVDRMFADPTGLGGAYERNVGSVGAVFGYRFY